MSRRARSGRARACLALVAALVPAQSARAQEPAAGPKPGEIQKLLELTRNGSPVVRPQAAQRLVRLGAPALEAIRALLGEGPEDLAGLGPELLGELGSFDDPALEARLAAALGDLDFPWRPALLRALAQSPGSADLPRFQAALGDVLAAAREGALVGLQTLEDQGVLDAAERQALEPLVRARLLDPSDGVRRRAALLLDAWGDGGALAYLLEDLRRSDRFFDLDCGGLARRSAAQLLTQRLQRAPRPGRAAPAGDRAASDDPPAAAAGGAPAAKASPDALPLGDYDPRFPPEVGANPAALAALEQRLIARAGGRWPELPPIARAPAARPPLLLGLELRSCRRGEAWLGLGADDRLYVGLGTPRAVVLPAGSSARLLAAADAAQRGLETDLFGRPGCDLERYRFGDGSAPAEREWHVLKDAAPAGDLRPAPIDGFAKALLEVLQAGDSEAQALGAELSALFEAVGGPL